MTTDGRFGVFKRSVPIDPMVVTEKWKIGTEYSIHDFRDYAGPKEFIELAPEVGRVKAYKEVFPWLGVFTGEGSFELGNLGRREPKSMGKKVQEVKDFLAVVLCEDID
jgi:hypothetical protein